MSINKINFNIKRRFLFSFSLVFISFIFSCISCESPNVTSDNMDHLDLCSVAENIEEYDGRFIRMKAFIRGFHSLIIYNNKCMGVKNAFLADLDTQAFSDLNKAMIDINSNRSEISGEILLEGIVRKNQGYIYD